MITGLTDVPLVWATLGIDVNTSRNVGRPNSRWSEVGLIREDECLDLTAASKRISKYNNLCKLQSVDVVIDCLY